MLETTSNYVISANIGGVSLILPLILSRSYLGGISQSVLQASPEMARSLIACKRRHLLASVFLYTIFVDVPIAYWIVSGSLYQSLFIWMVGFIFFIVGSTRNGIISNHKNGIRHERFQRGRCECNVGPSPFWILAIQRIRF
jgi:hypothetical protein